MFKRWKKRIKKYFRNWQEVNLPIRLSAKSDRIEKLFFLFFFVFLQNCMWKRRRNFVLCNFHYYLFSFSIFHRAKLLSGLLEPRSEMTKLNLDFHEEKQQRINENENEIESGFTLSFAFIIFIDNSYFFSLHIFFLLLISFFPFHFRNFCRTREQQKINRVVWIQIIRRNNDKKKKEKLNLEPSVNNLWIISILDLKKFGKLAQTFLFRLR